MFTLIIENRNGEISAEHSFEEGEFIIGRSHHCDIILSSPNVSRRHGRLFVQGGRAYIEDMNSSNGIYVGGKRVSGVVELGHSAQIRISDFILQLEGTPYSTAPTNVVHGRVVVMTPEGPGKVFWINKSSVSFLLLS